VSAAELDAEEFWRGGDASGAPVNATPAKAVNRIFDRIEFVLAISLSPPKSNHRNQFATKANWEMRPRFEGCQEANEHASAQNA
jgi:hypothetical protein